MTRVIIGALLVLLGLMTFAVHDARTDLSAQSRVQAHTRDSLKAELAQAILAQAPARIDTVREIVDRVTTLRDSVMTYRTDTLLLERFIYQTDTLRVQCLRCAALLDSIRVKYAAESHATETYISMLRGEVARAKRHRLVDRFGLGIGYGFTKIGSELHAGPQVQLQLRVLP